MTVANSSARPGTAPTPRELEVLEAWSTHGTARAAATHLGMTNDGVNKMLANIRARMGVNKTRDAAAERPRSVLDTA